MPRPVISSPAPGRVDGPYTRTLEVKFPQGQKAHIEFKATGQGLYIEILQGDPAIMVRAEGEEIQLTGE